MTVLLIIILLYYVQLKILNARDVHDSAEFTVYEKVRLLHVELYS